MELIAHIDNTPTHNPKTTENFFGHNPLKRLPYPRYSPDVSPSDFYLCGKVKGELIEAEVPGQINLPEAVIEILSGLSDAELQCVFRSWIEHIERMLETGGDYLT
jgi:hypothetical protein